MAKIIRSIFFIAIFTLVTSCAVATRVPGGHEKITKERIDALNKLIGLPQEEVIEKLGKPAELLLLDDQHYLIYRSLVDKYSVNAGIGWILIPFPIYSDKKVSGQEYECLMIRIGSDNLAQEYHFKCLDTSDLTARCLDIFFSERVLEHATIELGELNELNELIGRSKEEVIEKVGTPSEYVFLDDQHYLFFRSFKNQCLMIRVDSDNLLQEYHFKYFDISDLRSGCLDVFFSESELEHAIVLDDFTFDGQVKIDIRPHSYSNHVDPASNEDISVAILSAINFDARSVKPSIVAFGPLQAAISSNQAWKDVDVNDDGNRDRIFLFKISETGIACGDKKATLTGQTFEGYPISGSDWVMTVNCD